MILRLGRRGRAFESRRSHHYLIIKYSFRVIAEQWGRVRVMTLKWSKLIGSELRHVFINSQRLWLCWNLKEERLFWLSDFYFSWLDWCHLWHLFMLSWLLLSCMLESKCLWVKENSSLNKMLVKEYVWNVEQKFPTKNAQTVTPLRNDFYTCLNT